MTEKNMLWVLYSEFYVLKTELRINVFVLVWDAQQALLARRMQCRVVKDSKSVFNRQLLSVSS
jgi:hypothetical protein